MRFGCGLGIALLFTGCAQPLPELPEGTLSAPGCHYEEASRAAYEATEQYLRAQRARALERPLEEYLEAKETTEHKKQEARECETRAREWSELWAQWQSARAAANMARLSRAQIVWTIVEIVALLMTVGVGVWAILRAKADGNRDFGLLREQVDEGRVESERQHERFRQQLAVAEASTEASLAANKGFSESSKRELRAYIAAYEVSPKPLKPGEAPRVTIRLKNTGKTPARDVCAWFTMIEAEKPAREKVRFKGLTDGSRSDLGPDCPMELTIEFEKKITSDDLLAYQAGKLTWEAVALLRYRDVFRRTRWLLFRGYFNRDAPAVLSIARKHNGAN
jgi:hypothetical protein